MQAGAAPFAVGSAVRIQLVSLQKIGLHGRVVKTVADLITGLVLAAASENQKSKCR